jgi:hypothetical protein
MSNLIEINSKDESEEMVKQLINKKFYAISVNEKGRYVSFRNRMSYEEICAALTIAIQKETEDFIND